MKNNRWYIYQKERFPLMMYVWMILAFSFSAISYSSILRNGTIVPWSVAVSFVISLSFFMLLRIADEHKDYEDDCKYRPYRAVPRGLVKLRELFNIGVFLIAVQFIFTILLSYKLLILLAILWLYYFLMTKEFFVSKWLKKHMAIYMLSHMLILPLLDMFAAACDFLPKGSYAMAVSFIWFVLSSFFDGIVIEIGRKVRAPGDEEPGVDTYSAMWGRPKSVTVFIAAMTLSMIATGIATSRIGGFFVAIPVLAAVFVICLTLALLYLRKPTTENAKRMETVSGIWTIVDYVCLGVLPLIFLK